MEKGCSRPTCHWTSLFAIIRTKSKTAKETTFIKRPLQLIVSLEADQLETKQQEPTHGQFGSKRLAATNADAIRRLTCT